jgi:parvulin-like peptidyl-prolyl isomerase
MDVKRDILNRMIDEKILVLEGEKRGISETEDFEFYMKVMEKNFTIEFHLDMLESQGTEVSLLEMKRVYNQLATEYQIRHIMLDSQEKAEEIYQELLEGGDFEALAKEHTTDVNTREAGGDLGWVPEFFIEEPLSSVFFSLDQGGFTEPFEIKSYYHIFQRLGVRDAERKPFEEIEGQIRKLLEDNKYGERKQYIREYVQSFRDKTILNYEDDLITEMAMKATKTPDGTSLSEFFTEEEKETLLFTFQRGSKTIGQFLREIEVAESPPPLKTPGSVISNIEKMAVRDLLYEEAFRRQIHKYSVVRKELNAVYEKRVQKLLRLQEREEPLKVTDGEAREYYEENKKDYGTASFKGVRKEIRKKLLDQKTRELDEGILKDSRPGVDISINEPLLENVKWID